MRPVMKFHFWPFSRFTAAMGLSQKERDHERRQRPL
jgi:hypothetical protein